MELDMPVMDAPDDEGENAPRRSYNFAPGYHGLVYRASTSDRGAGSHHHHRDSAGTDGAEKPSETEMTGTSYKLQSMKWGLIPFWTKRNPDYGTIMKAINCRDDSLSTPGGMWSTMKARKRCIVVAEGFFEWLKTGPKNKLPHYIKRKDGQLMCFAGLWDCVEYEGKALSCRLVVPMLI
jgi:putative SOS response-associated peptidase YedK